MDRYWDHYQQALMAKDAGELEKIIEAFGQLLGFSHYGMAIRLSQTENRSAKRYRYCHNIDGELGRGYEGLDSESVQGTEPRILHAKRWLPPVSWNSQGASSLILPPDIRTHARRKLIQTGELGLHSGITIPVHASGIDWSFITFSATTHASPGDLAPTLLPASYFANCVQTALSRDVRESQAAPALTGREIDVLRWSAIGKTSWEISLIEKISESTVNFHLQRAAAKLGVRGRRAAVAQALARNLIRL